MLQGAPASYMTESQPDSIYYRIYPLHLASYRAETKDHNLSD